MTIQVVQVSERPEVHQQVAWEQEVGHGQDGKHLQPFGHRWMLHQVDYRHHPAYEEQQPQATLPAQVQV